MSHLCDSPERTAGTFLKTAAMVFSRWFLVMRAAVSRERARQQAYRDANNLKKKAKVPSEPLALTDVERCMVDYSEATIRAMFGDEVADYARDHFAHAMQTGDMRAFKLRLLILKARASLQGPLQDEFARWTDLYIEQAEAAAGCKPCPGPRRMSKAEKERKRLRESANDYYEGPWFSNQPTGNNGESQAQPPNPQHSAGRKARGNGRRRRKAMDILSQPAGEGLPPMADVVSSISKVMGGATIEDMAATIEEEKPDHGLENGLEKNVEKNEPLGGDGPVIAKDDSVTVTPNVTNPQYLEQPKRKVYDSVGEILEDISAGRIQAYKTPGEVVDAMKRGELMPHEAMLFISALDKLSDNGHKHKRSVRSRAKLELLPPEEDEEDEDAGGEDRFDDPEGEDDGEDVDGYSYNPSGFGGCCQGDDNW